MLLLSQVSYSSHTQLAGLPGGGGGVAAAAAAGHDEEEFSGSGEENQMIFVAGIL